MVSLPCATLIRGSCALRKSSTTAHSTGDPGSIGEEVGIAQVLVQLRSANPQGAWEQFLLQYGRVLYQAVRTSTRDEEAAADCFVFVSEKLAEKGYRRLLRFKPEGAASFVAWLRVVARNLCFDWQRQQLQRVWPSLRYRDWLWFIRPRGQPSSICGYATLGQGSVLSCADRPPDLVCNSESTGVLTCGGGNRKVHNAEV